MTKGFCPHAAAVMQRLKGVEGVRRDLEVDSLHAGFM